MIKCKRVLIGPSSFGDIDSAPLDLLEESDFSIIENPFKRKLTRDELLGLLPGVDGLIAGLEALDMDVLSCCDLKVISRCGSGMSNVDLDAAKECGIQVFNTPFGPTQAVAELTIGCLLSLIRNVPQMNGDLHRGKWKKQFGRQLHGMTVLIIGYGRIGERVGTILETLGVKVVFCDPAFRGESDCNRVANICEILPASDVVTLHCSGEKQILGKKEFKLMKDGVFILNAARGGLIDEKALKNALDSGKIAGAWLDTFGTEPYDGPLIKYEQVILTPHIGSYTYEGRLQMEIESVKNLLRGFGEVEEIGKGH